MSENQTIIRLTVSKDVDACVA